MEKKKKKKQIDIMSKEYKMYKSNSMKNKIQRKKKASCWIMATVYISYD